MVMRLLQDQSVCDVTDDGDTMSIFAPSEASFLDASLYDEIDALENKRYAMQEMQFTFVSRGKQSWWQAPCF